VFEFLNVILKQVTIEVTMKQVTIIETGNYYIQTKSMPSSVVACATSLCNDIDFNYCDGRQIISCTKFS